MNFSKTFTPFTNARRALICATLIAGYVHADDMADTPEFAHAMQIETAVIDDFPVVLQYGEIRPDFNDRANSSDRLRTSLDGAWKFSFDPETRGMAEEWYSTMNIDDWTAVTVPHCWDMMPGGRFWDWSDRSVTNPPHYDGAAWYRKDFTLRPEKDRQYRLEFLGVQQRARVFLNGELLAKHEGGGQPFSVNITKSIRSGNNTLAVQVIRLTNYTAKKDGKGFDELRPVHTQHPKAPDNWPYAGISRSVTLVSENAVNIRKTQIRTIEGRLEAAVCIENYDTSVRTVEVSIASAALGTSPAPQTVRLEPNQKRVLRFTAPIKEDAKQWSTESPAIQQLSSTLKEGTRQIDSLQTRFGIRTFETKGASFELNGKPIFLKGVSFYEEHPDRGHALTEKDHEDYFRLSKEADANFIRLHVRQRAPYVYELADKLGVLICGEWGGFWYNEKSMRAQSQDDRSIYHSLERCAVWDLMNHPSVVLWGTHNEAHQFCPEYEDFLKAGNAIAKQLDWQKRPITWAAWHPTKGQPKFEYADAVGFNEYRGAMDPFEDLDPDMREATEQNPNKPLIIMENGAWSYHGWRGPKDKVSTEDWHADLLRRQHEVLTQHMPPLSGYTIWLLLDYRSRKTYTGNEHSNGWSRMGLYNELGQPKLARDVFRDLKWEPQN